MFDINYVVLSDIHLPSRFCNISLLKAFLYEIKDITNTLILNGDIFDLNKFSCEKRKVLLDESVYNLFSDFKVVYILGNHDNLSLVFRNLNLEIKTVFSERDFLIMHGHIFDSTFGENNVLCAFLDQMEYLLSCITNIYLREKLNYFIDKFYNTFYYSKVIDYFLKLRQRYFIIGHTHIPKVISLGDKKIFNLGTWFSQPYAFFVNDTSYAFHKITFDNLLPRDEEWERI